MKENSGQIHIVLVPWAAFGHIMPMFQLSIALAKLGVHASIVSTPRNILKLPKLPPQLQPFIHLVALPFPAIDDRHSLLPEGAEATVDIPFEKIQFLKKSYDLLKNPFKEFISEISPDWIISDCLTHWVAEAGQELNIPIIGFYILSAASTVFFGPPDHHRTRTSPESMMVKPWWVNFESKVAFRKHEALEMYHQSFTRDASGISSSERVAIVFNASKAIAIRSCREFELEFLDLQEKISGKPAIPVGFLPPVKGTSSNHDDEWKNAFKWLDDQTPKSVFFVGFGSECKLRNDQIDTIARGLELSGVRFIWVLQNGDGLPLDFSSSVSGKGVVKLGWAPQREILGHPSIGGCLFHGGWGSVIETLQYGHCLVVLPFIIDQGLNARLLVEKGLAIEVERGEDGSFTEECIADSLRKAMALRARSEEAAAIFGDQELNDRYVEAFVKYMKMNGVKQ